MNFRLITTHTGAIHNPDESGNKGQACDFAILQLAPEIIRKVLRPHRTRVQTAAFLGRFNLDVAKQNRAACFHELGRANAAEDAINKTHAVDDCAGETGDPHHPRTVSKRGLLI